jgi:hypothetical protein
MKADRFDFTGRKPSMRQCLAAAQRLAKTGADHIELAWGENWLQLMRQANGYWAGFGFIRDIDADRIAREMNHA